MTEGKDQRKRGGITGARGRQETYSPEIEKAQKALTH